jgi:hypothetical protein
VEVDDNNPFEAWWDGGLQQTAFIPPNGYEFGPLAFVDSPHRLRIVGTDGGIGYTWVLELDYYNHINDIDHSHPGCEFAYTITKTTNSNF